MLVFLWILEILIGVLLVLAVLMQVGRGETIASMFGGGGHSIFGPKGPTTILEKITLGLIAAFFVVTISIAKLSSTPTYVPQRPEPIPEAPPAEELLPIKQQEQKEAQEQEQKTQQQIQERQQLPQNTP